MSRLTLGGLRAISKALNVDSNELNSEDVMKIVDTATSKGLYIEEYEGNLLDDYIIFNNNNKINVRGKTAKYICFLEMYKNCWSSSYKVKYLNDPEKLELLKNQRYNEY